MRAFLFCLVGLLDQIWSFLFLSFGKDTMPQPFRALFFSAAFFLLFPPLSLVFGRGSVLVFVSFKREGWFCALSSLIGPLLSLLSGTQSVDARRIPPQNHLKGSRFPPGFWLVKRKFYVLRSYLRPPVFFRFFSSRPSVLVRLPSPFAGRLGVFPEFPLPSPSCLHNRKF